MHVMSVELFLKKKTIYDQENEENGEPEIDDEDEDEVDEEDEEEGEGWWNTFFQSIT